MPHPARQRSACLPVQSKGRRIAPALRVYPQSLAPSPQPLAPGYGVIVVVVLPKPSRPSTPVAVTVIWTTQLGELQGMAG